jgi:hypothetical protein
MIEPTAGEIWIYNPDGVEHRFLLLEECGNYVGGTITYYKFRVLYLDGGDVSNKWVHERAWTKAA